MDSFELRLVCWPVELQLIKCSLWHVDNFDIICHFVFKFDNYLGIQISLSSYLKTANPFWFVTLPSISDFKVLVSLIDPY